MAKRRQKSGKRHRLQVYFRAGQRLRTKPLMLMLVSLLLLGIMYFAPDKITFPWLGEAQRPLVIALIVASAGLYLVSIFISRISVVQARADYLYVRAGVVPVAISYTRISKMRPVQVGQQFPPKTLKGNEHALMHPFLADTAVAIDLRAFPMGEKTLRRLWSKFMFVSDEKGLMLLVKDYALLNREIDDFRQRYLDRMSDSGESGDIFERVAHRHSEQ